MRTTRTLSRHVLREVCVYAGIGLFAVGALLVLQNLLRQLEDLLGLGVRAGDALALLGALTLWLSGYVLPIALLFGILVAIGQLASDGEVGALRALGVSLFQLAAPVFALALVTAAASARLIREAEPWARRSLSHLAVEIAGRGGVIQPGVLSPLDRAGERLVLVDRRDPDGTLRGVFLSDRTDAARPFVVTARAGRFSFDAARGIAHLRLQDGDLQLEPADARDARSQRIAFRGLDYAFDVRAVKLLAERPRPREMSDAELRAALAHFARTGEAPPGARERNRSVYEIQLQRRAALPLAPLVFAALGFPLALRPSRGARSCGALVCVGPRLLLLHAALGGRVGGELRPARERARPVAPERGLRSARRAAARAGARRELVSAAPPGFVCAGAPGVLLVARADLAPAARALGLDAPGGWERACAAGERLAGGRGIAIGLPWPPAPAGVVLRRLRHGGLFARWLGEAFLGARRALRELAVNAELHAAGAPVPAPACVAAQRWWGPLWRCAIGTERVPRAAPLGELLAGKSDPPRARSALEASARAIRRLHDRGGRHPDLNVRNLLVRESGDVIAIDLDRARRGPPPGAALRARELMRLWRSMLKEGHLRGASAAERARIRAELLDAYCAGAPELRRALLRWLPWEDAKLALRRWRYR